MIGKDNNKLIWLLAVIVVPLIGLIASFFLGIVGPALILLLLLLGIIAFIDILKSGFKDNNKLIYLLAVIFALFIGLIAYYFLGIGFPELIILLFLLLLGIPWIIAFIDILKSDFEGNNKLIWLLAVIFVPFIGLIAYFSIGHKQKIKEKME